MSQFFLDPHAQPCGTATTTPLAAQNVAFSLAQSLFRLDTSASGKKEVTRAMLRTFPWGPTSPLGLEVFSRKSPWSKSFRVGDDARPQSWPPRWKLFIDVLYFSLRASPRKSLFHGFADVSSVVVTNLFLRGQRTFDVPSDRCITPAGSTRPPCFTFAGHPL